MSSPSFLLDVGGALVLPASCGADAASELHAELLNFRDSDRQPLIDASSVETVGQATLQLLVAARAEWPNLCIMSPSDAFASRVHACALADALGLHSAKEA